jgi:decaprenylphospho-beta-D-ribofuranose 2-oxidase
MGLETLSGWGRYPLAECAVERPSDTGALNGLLGGSTSAIALGNGRSYGDSSLNPHLTLQMTGLDRMLAFDEATGVLVCEGGVMLEDVIATFLPRGWFVNVTPGTRFVTVGGMVASDVHGKNHHGAGSFCDYLEWIDLAIGPDDVLRCSRGDHADLFAATAGGMGLTGVVLRAAFRLLKVETAAIRQQTTRSADLAETLSLLTQGIDWTYSVAWTDCLAKGAALGRSVVFLGEHAGMDELPAEQRAKPLERAVTRRMKVPVDCPDFTISNLSVKAFNAMYYRVPRPREGLFDIDKYFYPLDSLLQWNRLYGRRGFVQYQCVLPPEESFEGLRRLLTEIAAQGEASFLVVLKRMGPQSFGLLSFPQPGFTLAVDFPAKRESFLLMARLDAITAEHRGRVYLAKDARTSPEAFAAGYPGLAAFRQVREQYGLAERFQSLQSRRLEI